MKTPTLSAIALSLCAPLAWAQAPATEEVPAPSTLSASRATLELKAVEVYETKPKGTKWDSALLGKKSAPDLMVEFFFDGRSIFKLKAPRKDTLSATWENALSVPFELTEGEHTLEVVVIDKDVKRDDEIGKISFKPELIDAREDKLFRLAGGRVKELQVQLHDASDLVEVEDMEEAVITPTPVADEAPKAAEASQAPAEEPKAPAEEPKAPAEEPKTPAEEPKAPAEEPKAPAEEPKAPAEEPKAPAEEAPEAEAPAPATAP